MSDKDRTITGKKFSKVIHWNETSTQQQIDAAGGYSDFAGALKMWRDIATDYLKSKNLPYSEIVYYSPGADSWQLSPPVGNRQLSTGLIKSYIIKKRGFDPDSPEGFAARILHISYLYKKPDFDQLLLAMELGKIETLINVYSTEKNILDNGRPHKEKTKHFIAVAESMVKAYDINKKDYWKKLKNEDIHPCYLNIDKGKEYLCFDFPGGKTVKISEKTFTQNYIPEAKDSQKK